jgi:hypothetical protein
LIKKGMDLDPFCYFCKAERETVVHVIWECPSASHVWGDCGKKIQKYPIVVNKFSEVMELFFGLCTPEEVDINAEIARRIWFRRNTVVHGGDFLHPNELIILASNFIRDYKGAIDSDKDALVNGVVPTVHGVSVWSPPPSGVFKANWNAVIDSKSGKMGFGCLVRDCHGRVVAAVSQILTQ